MAELLPPPWYVGEFREARVRTRSGTQDTRLALELSIAGDLSRFPTLFYASFPWGATQADVAKELRSLADRVERGSGEQLC